MKVKNVLISQPQPPNYEKSPYFDVSKKFGLNISFKKFIKIEPVSAQEFRKAKINILDYSAIIFTCNKAVDHFFRLSKEMRLVVPGTTKFFCISEKTAFYLQKYVTYKKRCFLHGNESLEELINLIKTHLEEKFLMPCTEGHKHEIVSMLSSNKIPVRKAIIYKTISDLEIKKTIDLKSVDMFVFFSPFGIKSLFENFPDFKQNGTFIAAWGKTTQKAAKDAGLTVNIQGPTSTISSMPTAIDVFLGKLKKAI